MEGLFIEEISLLTDNQLLTGIYNRLTYIQHMLAIFILIAVLIGVYKLFRIFI